MVSENCMVLHVIKGKERKKKGKSSTWWYPSQCTKGLTQIDKAGVLVPVEVQKWGWGWWFTNGDSDAGFTWSNTREMTSSNVRLSIRCWV
jgi:hypothetical protein